MELGDVSLPEKAVRAKKIQSTHSYERIHVDCPVAWGGCAASEPLGELGCEAGLFR